MKIIQLTASNLLRLHAVEITPNGQHVIIGGSNAQGKTACLDAVAIALGAKLPKEPVRRGAESADITLKLTGGFLLRKHITKAGSSLVITKDGEPMMSPQAIADSLLSKVSFDPLEFLKMKPKEQAETLRTIVGLDFTQLEAERAALYEERTIINREAKSAKATADNAISYLEVPGKEESAAELITELSAIAARNAEKQKQRDAVERLKDNGVALGLAYLKQVAEIDRLKEALRVAQENESKALVILEATRANYLEQKKTATELVDEPTEALTERMAAIEATNRKVRANVTKRTWLEQAEAKKTEADALTDKIDALDASKAKQLAEAKFPVPGLSFTTDGVQFRQLPFEQASSAERLRVSAGIGIAMNQTLKVLLIRDASLLDEEGKQMILEMADEAGCQVLMEVVGEGGATVVISDGRVKGADL